MTQYRIGAVEGGSKLLPQIQTDFDPTMKADTIRVEGAHIGTVDGQICLNFHKCTVLGNGPFTQMVDWDTPLSVGRDGFTLATGEPIDKQVFLVTIRFSGHVAVITSMQQLVPAPA